MVRKNRGRLREPKRSRPFGQARPLRQVGDEERVVDAHAAGSRAPRATAGLSIDSTISALPPSRLRETAMFAMFTPGLAEQRADAADHAGHVVVAQEDHPRRELDLDLEAERRDEPLAVLACRSSCRRRAMSPADDRDQVP